MSKVYQLNISHGLLFQNQGSVHECIAWFPRQGKLGPGKAANGFPEFLIDSNLSRLKFSPQRKKTIKSIQSLSFFSSTVTILQTVVCTRAPLLLTSCRMAPDLTLATSLKNI